MMISVVILCLSFGTIFGVFLAAALGAGSTSDREKAAFTAGRAYAKAEAQREASMRPVRA